MAKSKKNSTTPPEFPVPAATAEFLRKLKVQWVAARAQDTELTKARSALDRVLGIEMGLIPPPWLKKSKPKWSDAKGSGAAWVAHEARRMKAAGEIPARIKITHFAQELEGRMRKAAKADDSIRPLQWRSIKNGLPGWGLWPIDSI